MRVKILENADKLIREAYAPEGWGAEQEWSFAGDWVEAVGGERCYVRQ
jgi:hypothetical protein